MNLKNIKLVHDGQTKVGSEGSALISKLCCLLQIKSNTRWGILAAIITGSIVSKLNLSISSN